MSAEGPASPRKPVVRPNDTRQGVCSFLVVQDRIGLGEWAGNKWYMESDNELAKEKVTLFNGPFSIF